MSESPLKAVMDMIASVPFEEWRRYCDEHPPARDTCKWCGQGIVSTPWFAPSGTCHLTGWMHEATENNSCGSEHPYRFAEPCGVGVFPKESQ